MAYIYNGSLPAKRGLYVSSMEKMYYGCSEAEPPRYAVILEDGSRLLKVRPESLKRVKRR